LISQFETTRVHPVAISQLGNPATTAMGREYTAPTIAKYRAVPDGTTALEKKLPQGESGAERG